jgi:heat-inducible transcriptional repressor
MAFHLQKRTGMELEILSEREHQVLESVVRNYILSASPTGSRYISKQKGFELSAASIRNVMSDLEDRGFIVQPHTSAGRIPSDKGYRYYVDRLMKNIDLPDETKTKIRSSLITVDHSDLHLVLEAATRALSRTTNQLGVILAPKLRSGVLRHIYLFEIQENRYMMNVALDYGFVKSMMIELQTDVPLDRLECACRIITSKCAGKTVHEMCETDDGKFGGIPEFDLGVIRLLVPSLRKMMDQDHDETVFTEGQTNVLLQPEFFSRDRVGAVMEIFEEKNLLMHLFETTGSEDRVFISIGGENQEGQLQSFSIIKTNYRVGNMQGSLGVIGPKRMPYPYLISAVEYTAKVLGELHS